VVVGRKAPGAIGEEEIAVVGSMIRLGRCFDLLDPVNIATLKTLYDEFIRNYLIVNKAPPKNNAHSHRYLDRAVFEYAYSALNDQTGGRIDTCRAVYVPADKSKRIWRGSSISEESHVQLCVRNPKRILGTWLVRPRFHEGDHEKRESQNAEESLQSVEAVREEADATDG
jgi:hypothetical protein